MELLKCAAPKNLLVLRKPKVSFTCFRPFKLLPNITKIPAIFTENSDGVTVYQRGCSKPPINSNTPSCEQMEDQNGYTNLQKCYCFGNQCNGSTTITMTSLSMGLFGLLIISRELIFWILKFNNFETHILQITRHSWNSSSNEYKTIARIFSFENFVFSVLGELHQKFTQHI